MIGKAQNDPAFSVSFTLKFYGQNITIEKPVQYEYTDPTRGELHEPVAVIPALDISVSPSIIFTDMMRDGKAIEPQNISLELNSHITVKNQQTKIILYKGNSITWSRDTILDIENGKQYNFSVPVSALKHGDLNGNLYAGAEIN